jgi:hypothetical protein
MSFAFCDFHHQGGAAQMLMARAVARPRLRHRAESSSEAPRTEVSARVETPRVESATIEPVKSGMRPGTAKSESALELRRSTQ